MRILTVFALTVCFSVGGSSAGAWCFPFPFSGGWGVGYSPIPTWGTYYRGYAPTQSWVFGYRGYAPCPPLCCPDRCCSAQCGSICGVSCNKSIKSDKVPNPVPDSGFRDGTDGPSGDSRQRWQPYDANDSRIDPPAVNPREETRSDLQERERPWKIEDETELNDYRPGSDSPDSATESGRIPGLFDSSRDDEEEGPEDDDETSGFGAHRVERPPLEPPVDKSEKSGGGDSKNDVLVPPSESEDSSQSRLLRGILSDTQARTERGESSTYRRLTAQPRGIHWSRSVDWSGGNDRRQPLLRWIEAPAHDGRVRL